MWIYLCKSNYPQAQKLFFKGNLYVVAESGIEELYIDFGFFIIFVDKIVAELLDEKVIYFYNKKRYFPRKYRQNTYFYKVEKEVYRK